MDSDAETIGNIILHPGDTLAVDIHDPTSATVRLLDSSGRCYATLDCDRPRPDEYRIASLYWSGERRVLPVHAQLKPVPQPLPQPHPNGDGDVTTYTITVPVDPGRPDLYATSVVHAHLHWHPDFRPGDRGNARHSHPHPHTGTDVHRAALAGHDDDPHEHPHP